MSEIIKQILRELKEQCDALYGARLKGIYVFGSYARNEADEESDLDILIVLDQVDHYAYEILRTGEIISALSLKYGITISRVFTSERQWKEDQTLFFLNVREEAIPA